MRRCSHAGGAVDTTGLTCIACSVHCILPVGTCIHTVSCTEGEVIINTGGVVRPTGVALDGRGAETGQAGWIAKDTGII